MADSAGGRIMTAEKGNLLTGDGNLDGYDNSKEDIKNVMAASRVQMQMRNCVYPAAVVAGMGPNQWPAFGAARNPENVIINLFNALPAPVRERSNTAKTHLIAATVPGSRAQQTCQTSENCAVWAARYINLYEGDMTSSLTFCPSLLDSKSIIRNPLLLHRSTIEVTTLTHN